MFYWGSFINDRMRWRSVIAGIQQSGRRTGAGAIWDRAYSGRSSRNRCTKKYVDRERIQWYHTKHLTCQRGICIVWYDNAGIWYWRNTGFMDEKKSGFYRIQLQDHRIWTDERSDFGTGYRRAEYRILVFGWSCSWCRRAFYCRGKRKVWNSFLWDQNWRINRYEGADRGAERILEKGGCDIRRWQ